MVKVELRLVFRAAKVNGARVGGRCRLSCVLSGLQALVLERLVVFAFALVDETVYFRFCSVICVIAAVKSF